MTVVVFRTYKRPICNKVMALFPYVVGFYDAKLCAAYQHTGQYKEVDPDYVLNISRVAVADEYKELKEELENAGYELDIRATLPQDHYKVRLLQIKQCLDVLCDKSTARGINHNLIKKFSADVEMIAKDKCGGYIGCIDLGTYLKNYYLIIGPEMGAMVKVVKGDKIEELSLICTHSFIK